MKIQDWRGKKQDSPPRTIFYASFDRFVKEYLRIINSAFSDKKASFAARVFAVLLMVLLGLLPALLVVGVVSVPILRILL